LPLTEKLRPLRRRRVRRHLTVPANGWENGTIEAFLDAAAAWATASKNGLEFYRKPDNPWKRCADII